MARDRNPDTDAPQDMEAALAQHLALVGPINMCVK